MQPKIVENYTKELQIRQKFEKWKKCEIATLEPRNRFHSLTRTSPIATATKTQYNCRRVAPKPHFSSEFSSGAKPGPVWGENQNSIYYYAGPFLLGGDHIPTSNNVISSVSQAVRGNFSPQKWLFWPKMPILGSHIIHISHSVSWYILLNLIPYPKCE